MKTAFLTFSKYCENTLAAQIFYYHYYSYSDLVALIAFL